MKHLTELTDSELVAVAQKTVAKYTKAYSEAKEIAHEYGFDMGETDSNILNAVFAKLKEKRDVTNKESVEKAYQSALALLIKGGFYAKVKELMSLFDNCQYIELKDALVKLNLYSESQVKKFGDVRYDKSSSSSKMDYSKYRVNGSAPLPKGRVAEEVVRIFATHNPELNSKDIVRVFRTVAFGNYDWYFITEQEYEEKKRSSSDYNFERRYKEVVISLGERVFVSNQYNIRSITSFMDNVNRQNWGITIEKM